VLLQIQAGVEPRCQPFATPHSMLPSEYYHKACRGLASISNRHQLEITVIIMPKKNFSLDNIDQLDETEFEEFCFELLGELGFVNIDWRKGTALSSNPADRRRDIVTQHVRIDEIDGARHLET
jgi:hypothetical protein